MGVARRRPDPDVAARGARKAEALNAVTQAADDPHATEEQAKPEVDAARERFRQALREAYEAGSSYSELGELPGLSRQRIAQHIQG